MEQDIRKIVETIKNIPTLPTIVNEINRLMANPKTSADDLSKLISNDQAITAKVLKVVNSAYYGFPRSINTITHAIVILGFEAVRDIAISVAFFDKFGRKGRAGQFDRAKFWEHSLGVAIVAKIIARKIAYKRYEEVFISGLLHDIGKVILDQQTPQEFVETIDKTFNEDILLYTAEKAVYGYTHAELGMWVCEKWKLPVALCESVGYHHRPLPILAKSDFDMTALVHLADIFTRALGIGNGGDNRIPEVNEDVWQRYKDDLKVNNLQRLFEEIDTEMSKAIIFLSFLE